MISKLAHRYCYEVENIENYEQAMADPLEIWDCHHRYEIYNGRTISRSTLKNRGLLYNRPASELIFLRHGDHKRLHIENMSEETRKKLSEKSKGENNPMYGRNHSEETCKMLREVNLGKHHTEESRKKMSESHKGQIPWNKGATGIFASEKHWNYGKHLSDETKKKISASKKGRHLGKYWYNNGVISVLARECPNGFVKGRIC